MEAEEITAISIFFALNTKKKKIDYFLFSVLLRNLIKIFVQTLNKLSVLANVYIQQITKIVVVLKVLVCIAMQRRRRERGRSLLFIVLSLRFDLL
jgi:uncharacterized integral membrane protein